MRTRLGLLTAVAAVALSVGLAGCGSSSKPSTVSSADLQNKTFVSRKVTGHTLVAGTKVTLAFEAATLVATAGCNTMSAPYVVDNSLLRWTSEPRSTLKGCPPERSAQDAWLNGFLRAGATASLSGARLTLKSNDTSIELDKS